MLEMATKQVDAVILTEELQRLSTRVKCQKLVPFGVTLPKACDMTPVERFGRGSAAYRASDLHVIRMVEGAG